jgi:hypothetical protein
VSVRVRVDDLAPALDLICQPLVLEALAAADDGKALGYTLAPDTDPLALAAAVHRLASIGAVRPSIDGPFGRHQLTNRGHELLMSIKCLNAAVASHRSRLAALFHRTRAVFGRIYRSH